LFARKHTHKTIIFVRIGRFTIKDLDALLFLVDTRLFFLNIEDLYDKFNE